MVALGSHTKMTVGDSFSSITSMFFAFAFHIFSFAFSFSFVLNQGPCSACIMGIAIRRSEWTTIWTSAMVFTLSRLSTAAIAIVHI